MKNLIEEGKTIDYTLTEETVASGEIVVVGDMAGVAVTGGKTGDTIALAVEGVYELPKGSGALAQGKKAYVNVAEDTGKTIVGTASGNTFIGYVWAAAAAGDATVAVKLSI